MNALDTKLAVFGFFVAVGLNGLPAAEPIKFETDPEQKLDVPYRLFKTQNMWNQLLIDTRDGRVWQVAFTIDKDGYRGKVPINSSPLVNPPGTVGRFTLYPTQNLWTYLILDTEEGAVWQCQFSLEKDGRFIIPLVTPEQEALTQAFLEIFTASEQKELQDQALSDEKKQEIVQRAMARLTGSLSAQEQRELQDQTISQARRQELIQKALRTLKEQKE